MLKRITRTLAVAAVLATPTLAMPAVALANSSDPMWTQCENDPMDIDCNQIPNNPPVYQAVGKDRDIDKAQAEAEAMAAASCPGHSYHSQKVLISTLSNGVVQWTILYSCS